MKILLVTNQKVIDFNCREIRYYDSMNGNNGECLKALK